MNKKTEFKEVTITLESQFEVNVLTSIMNNVGGSSKNNECRKLCDKIGSELRKIAAFYSTPCGVFGEYPQLHFSKESDKILGFVKEEPKEYDALDVLSMALEMGRASIEQSSEAVAGLAGVLCGRSPNWGLYILLTRCADRLVPEMRRKLSLTAFEFSERMGKETVSNIDFLTAIKLSGPAVREAFISFKENEKR